MCDGKYPGVSRASCQIFSCPISFLQHFNLSECKVNKTAGYHRYIFRPRTLLKILSRGWKRVFFSKKSYLYQNLIIFPKLKLFWFLQKNSQFWWKTFLWNNIIWYANLQPLKILKKTRKNPNFVPFETSYYFSRILQQIRYNLVIETFHGQNRWTSKTFSHIGQYQLASKREKTSVLGVLSGWFSFRIIKKGWK